MIIDTLFSMLSVLFSALISLLPSPNIFPQAFTDAWVWLATETAALFYLLPMGQTLLQILFYSLYLQLGIFIWMLVKIVYNAIRGSGL